MGREIDYHAIRRIESLLNLLNLYPKLNSEQIERVYRQWDTKEKGVLAEIRAVKVLKKLPYVHQVNHSKRKEDNRDKVDLWVILIKRFGLENRHVPVQIKSSVTGCNKAYQYFELNVLRSKKAAGFKRPVILNAGLNRTDQQIVDCFVTEVRSLINLDLTPHSRI